jgi:hypothetical protein
MLIQLCQGVVTLISVRDTDSGRGGLCLFFNSSQSLPRRSSLARRSTSMSQSTQHEWNAAPLWQRPSLARVISVLPLCKSPWHESPHFAAVSARLAGAPVAWLVGALLIFAVIPFTVLAIMPTNKILLGPATDRSSELRPGIVRWKDPVLLRRRSAMEPADRRHRKRSNKCDETGRRLSLWT